jgi:uncharacterized protein with PIN domain
MEKSFLADVMVGRLARWLRVLGYDTLYTRKGIDSPLVVRAYKEDRIILTRCSKIYKKIGPERAVFIHFDNFRNQVSEVIDALNLKFDSNIFLSRCLECNLLLIPLPREEAQTKVPPYVFQTIEEFKTCPQCSKIFWSGTHIEEMRKLITAFWEKKGNKV